jgi:DivIVA domain-containing protein
MPLTAAEVRATKFSTTRVRSGYDMDEVDAFLDIIEADLTQFSDELQRSRDGEAVLRTQCDQLQSRLNASEERLAEAQGALASARQSVAVPQPADVSAIVEGNPEAQSVLAIAERTADEIIRYAQSQADSIRAEVRAMLKQQLGLVNRS